VVSAQRETKIVNKFSKLFGEFGAQGGAQLSRDFNEIGKG
jgi:hypothetical protein